MLCHQQLNLNISTGSSKETDSSNTTTMPHYWSDYFRRRGRIDRVRKKSEDHEEDEDIISNVMPKDLEKRRDIREMLCRSSFSLNSFLFSLFLLLVIPSLQLPQQQASNLRNLITLNFVAAPTSGSFQPKGSFFASASSAVQTGGYKINAALKPKSNSIQNGNNNDDTNSNINSTTSVQATSSNATTTEFLLNLVKSNFNQQLGGGANGTRLTGGKFRPGQQREHMHYKTTYACEGNQLDLSCQEGKLIHLVRANYGRFSLSICNDFGHSNYSVQCYSFRAFLLMETKCNKLSNCSVIVSKDLFGDPCEGTAKYLEVQYYCDDASNNQQIPSQPQTGPTSNGRNGQTLDGSGNKESAASADASPTDHKSPAAPAQVGGGSSPQPTDQRQQQQQQARDEQPSASVGHQPGTMSVIQQQQQQQRFCLPQTSARNLYWNYTRAGNLAKQNCPDGSSGKVSWLCDAERLRFVPGWSPDFSQCKSNWLQRLAQQLEQMLDQQQTFGSGKLSTSTDWQRQQNDQQTLRVILNDLALMASTKELFSEDLKRIDIMVSQMIGHLKSVSLVYNGSGSGWRSAFGGPGAGGQLLYEELFNKLAAIVSSLFEVGQRAAWLDVQPVELRKKLEQRYLNHVKDSGVMLANSLGPLALEQQPPLRQANVFAAITVIDGNRLSSPLAPIDMESNEFSLQFKLPQSQQQQTILGNRFVAEQDDQINEFRIHLSILRELVANGITRFLVLDIKKPDYSLIRHQLESSYANGLATGSDSTAMDTNLPGDQQWASRVFGVFAVSGENGDVFDGNSAPANNKLVDLLAQWPISVDFRVSPTTANQLQVSRQCNSLSDNVNQLNRCQTSRSNATNHICRCDQFGFVALTLASSQVDLLQQQHQQQQQVPNNALGQSDLQWPPSVGHQADFDPLSLSPAQRSLEQQPSLLPPAYVGPQDNKQQPLSIWVIIFIVLGLSVFIVTLAINAFVRATSQCRLNKKPGFLATGTSILGHHLAGEAGPTTGPLVDHSLMSGEPLTSSAAPTSASTTTQSSGASIIGLNSSSTTTCHSYKTHQQLYAAHYPALDGACAARGASNRWSVALRRWLRPSRWFAGSANPAKGMEQLGGVQHRIVGHPNLANQSHSSYKSNFQNGYTTSLPHHHHQSPVVAALASAGNGHVQQVPLAAPSSASSYVSSSAYYEEIGPGNLTKVNTNQLSSTHTIVDPFKRQPATDQQQLLASSGHLQQRPGVGQLQQQAWGSGGYQQQEAQQLMAGSNHYGPTIISSGAHNPGGKHQLHSDLSQLQQQQSSSSSAGSQHSSASTTITTANGSTPRHYLFASPSAASAYKNSMGPQQSSYQQQHHQQHLHQLQQQHFQQHQQQQRFMSNR